MSRASGEDTIQKNAAPVWRFELDMHEAQRTIFEDPARFKVAAAGRRFGKTLLAGASTIITAASKPDANVWWVSPSHPQSRIAQRLVTKVVPRQHRDVNKTLGEITLSNGGRISFKSAERWDNLRGEGLDMVVIDEAAFVAKEVWTQAIRPALSDRNGKALLISTFNGQNWFWEQYRFALDPESKEWAGWEFPTRCNPYIPLEEIDEARRSLPKEVFEQEYECSPLSFVGAVFDGNQIELAYVMSEGFVLPAAPQCEAGLDWGWNITALEICVEMSDGKIAWIDEEIYPRIELNKRCEMIADVCKKYNVQTVYADAAGATENVTLAKILEARGAPSFVQPVPFNAFKKTGIQTRNYYLQQGRELITHNNRQLVIDSKSYHYDEAGEKPAKGNDHTVDACTAFYSSRSYALGEQPEGEAA